MEIFPSGVAEGVAFCNRVVERQKLTSNIEKISHTILLAPRRYGKTSLIRQVLHENDFTYEWVDCLSVTSMDQLIDKISRATKDLLFKLSPELIKLTKTTVDMVKAMTPELNLSALGQSLSLHLTTQQKLPIDELLLAMDAYAEKVGKQAVFVFDEFQQISELENNHSVEALIRHAVERSKSITYIFSGSNRHLLQEMFSQSTRPLYRLCQPMPLERIKPTEYAQFISKAALNKWGKEFTKDAIDEILSLTECHSFYVNGLCNSLWEFKQLPQKEEVSVCWREYVESHKGMIVSDIVALPLGQKKVLQTLSDAPTQEPFVSAFSLKAKLASGSVRRAFQYLLKKDIIYQDEHGVYKVLDPALRYYLLNY